VELTELMERERRDLKESPRLKIPLGVTEKLRTR
jgi:hypothetical protein